MHSTGLDKSSKCSNLDAISRVAITNTIASTFPLLIYIPTHDYVYSSRLHGNYVGPNVSVPPNYICSYIHFHGIHTTLSSPTRQAGRQADRQARHGWMNVRRSTIKLKNVSSFVRSSIHAMLHKSSSPSANHIKTISLQRFRLFYWG